MGLRRWLGRFFGWWDGQTWGTQLWTARVGVRVGEDAFGNVYYRNADDSRRWGIFAGEIEASRTPPDWQAWLRRTIAVPPSDMPLPSQPWALPHQPNMTGTPLAYVPAGSLRAPEPARRADYESWQPE